MNREELKVKIEEITKKKCGWDHSKIEECFDCRDEGEEILALFNSYKDEAVREFVDSFKKLADRELEDRMNEAMRDNDDMKSISAGYARGAIDRLLDSLSQRKGKE